MLKHVRIVDDCIGNEESANLKPDEEYVFNLMIPKGPIYLGRLEILDGSAFIQVTSIRYSMHQLLGNITPIPGEFFEPGKATPFGTIVMAGMIVTVSVVASASDGGFVRLRFVHMVGKYEWVK